MAVLSDTYEKSNKIWTVVIKEVHDRQTCHVDKEQAAKRVYPGGSCKNYALKHVAPAACFLCRNSLLGVE